MSEKKNRKKSEGPAISSSDCVLWHDAILQHDGKKGGGKGAAPGQVGQSGLPTSNFEVLDAHRSVTLKGGRSRPQPTLPKKKGYV